MKSEHFQVRTEFFNRWFIDPHGSLDPTHCHHDRATCHPNSAGRLSWIDKSSWFAKRIQVPPKPGTCDWSPEEYLGKCFSEIRNNPSSYTAAVPHGDMPEWSVPNLDNFWWVERAVSWRVEQQCHLQETERLPRNFYSREANIGRCGPNPNQSGPNGSFPAHNLPLCGSFVAHATMWNRGDGLVIAQSSANPNDVFLLRNVSRGEGAAFRDIAAWALDAAVAGRLTELRDTVKTYGTAVIKQQCGPNGYTPLHKVCDALQETVVQYLVKELDFDVNLLTHDGLSPLLCLLRGCCTPSTTTTTGSLPLTAVEQRRHRIAKVLVAAGANTTIYSWAIFSQMMKDQKRLDTPRLALVGSTKLWLALSFRIVRNNDDSDCMSSSASCGQHVSVLRRCFNHDTLYELATWFLPQDNGLVMHFWYQLCDGHMWYCTPRMKNSATRRGEALNLNPATNTTTTQPQHPQGRHTWRGKRVKHGHPNTWPSLEQQRMSRCSIRRDKYRLDFSHCSIATAVLEAFWLAKEESKQPSGVEPQHTTTTTTKISNKKQATWARQVALHRRNAPDEADVRFRKEQLKPLEERNCHYRMGPEALQCLGLLEKGEDPR